MTIKQHIDHWVSSSDESIKDMQASIKSKRRLNAVYSGHQSVEKIMKALLAAQDVRVLFTHDLVKLSKLSGLELNDEQLDELHTINAFYIAAKYHGKKSEIYKRCTPKYTHVWTGKMRQWHKAIKREVLEIRKEVPNRTMASFPSDTY